MNTETINNASQSIDNESQKIPSINEVPENRRPGESSANFVQETQIADPPSSPKRSGVILGRASLLFSIAGITIPFILVAMREFQLASMAGVGLSALGITTGLGAVYPIVTSRRSLLMRLLSVSLLTVFALLSASIAFGVNEANSWRKNSAAVNNARQLMVAVHNFESVHGHFPADIVDQDGVPILSWRVALLPYLMEERLYQQFRLNEPWDSEHNRKLIDQMPACLSRPGVQTQSGNSPFERVFGNGEFESMTTKRNWQGLNTEASATVFLTEVDTKHSRPWTQPGGLDLSNRDSLNRLPDSNPGGVVIVGKLDGSTVSGTREEVVQLLSR